MNEICALCGSSVVYRTVDVICPASLAPGYMSVPAHCSNHHCPHASERDQPPLWTVRARERGEPAAVSTRSAGFVPPLPCDD
jgi:hypothetical protein